MLSFCINWCTCVDNRNLIYYNIKRRQRKDDNEETAKARFDTYFKETAPLIDYYKNKGVLRTINAEGSIDEVWERLLKVIND